MRHNNLFIIFLGIVFLQFSCRKFLEIDPPKASVEKDNIFRNDDLAISAMVGVYQRTYSGFANGGQGGIPLIGGLSSDELISYNSGTVEFYENQITPENSTLNSIYNNLYRSIYNVNTLIEGLMAPNTITLPVKTQLEGEARFVRAFCYFYLVNLFGPVPLHLETDYRINQVAPRTSISKIYEQIINDLSLAEGMLNEGYVTPDRVRPNKSAVQALLARAYLYRGDWGNAEKYSALVIGKTNTYGLVGLDNVFLRTSNEAIWQLMPNAGNNTDDGLTFILTATPSAVSLRDSFFANAFEPNDKRRTSWIKSFTNATGTYYYPFKYKIKSSSTVTEYSMVLRLAEQYLIRAEARVQLDKISGAIEDLDAIRSRAGIPLIKNFNPGIGKQDLLNAIFRERRVELFTEWSHRWLDLKRTGQATTILTPLKSGWTSTDMLYPIPSNEISRNVNITQNDGY